MKKLVLKFIVATLFFVTKISSAQNIYTIAGTGIAGFSGDGGLATSAQLSQPSGVKVDAAGNIYVIDTQNNRARKINTSGIISTFAGTGASGSGGDGGPATSAQFTAPWGIAIDNAGSIYIDAAPNSKLRKVNTLGIVSTVAGNGFAGSGGDGGLAVNANLSSPMGVTVDGIGNIYIAIFGNNKVRKVDVGGTITTFAGTGLWGFSGDGGLAINAQLRQTYATLTDGLGNVFIVDYGNERIRKVNSLGIISTFAGTGVAGFSGDGGPANLAQLSQPFGIAFDALGNMYIADSGNGRIRKIDTSGIISTFAGDGTCCFGGDGGPAINAQLNCPKDVAVDSNGNVYIADDCNQRIRMVCVSNCNLAGINQISVEGKKISVFPNPNNGSFKIKIDYKISNGEIILINSLGQTIYQQKIVSGENEITTNNLPNGLYNYMIIENKLHLSNGKVAIE